MSVNITIRYRHFFKTDVRRYEMASLTYRERALLENLFEMSSGYVLDFSNSTFEDFIASTVGIDIYDGEGYKEYCSKAKKLRQLWDKESNYTIGILLGEMLSYYEGYCIRENKELTGNEIKIMTEIKDISSRLKEIGVGLNLPKSPDENIKVLMDDIEHALARNKPVLVLDRLHTFATNFLRRTCVSYNIEIINNQGKYLPLQSLAGMLKKRYEQDGSFQSSFTLRAITNSISLFESYNDVRNNKSFAHVNEVLDTIEAQFVVEIMASVIKLIDEIETYQKEKVEVEVDETTIEDFELPF